MKRKKKMKEEYIKINKLFLYITLNLFKLFYIKII